MAGDPSPPGRTAMDFFRGLTGSSASSDPPASVLAEWNKYSTGDIESQGSTKAAGAPGAAQQPSFFGGLQTLLDAGTSATNTASSSMALYGTGGTQRSASQYRCGRPCLKPDNAADLSLSQPAPALVTCAAHPMCRPTSVHSTAHPATSCPRRRHPVPCSLRIPSGTQFVYFAALLAGAAIFYALSFFVFLPLLILSPSKFALSFTFGSLCTMGAMVMLSGWQAGLAHLFSKEKLPFSGVYIGSMVATLYAAIAMHSYLLSIVFSAVQARARS
jgi:Got1/Sft2-like family